MTRPARIGFSSCFLHRDPTRALFKGKTLLYMEESLAHWIFSEQALVFLIPSPSDRSPIKLSDIVRDLDGLVLQGGADVSPENYGEKPERPEWAGDPIRDRYEIALVKECLKQQKPILGICRGAQLLNVALGGSLYQDIQTQIPKASVHRDWNIYEDLNHPVLFEKGSFLEKVFKKDQAIVNSIHHQGIKDLAKDLVVEARCADDGMIEAVRHKSQGFVFAFQWHPEFHDPKDKNLLDCKPILKEFLRVALQNRK